MKKLLTAATLFVAFFAVIAMTSCTAQTPKASLKTDVDSLSYAIGVSQAQQGLDMFLAQNGVDSTNMDDFVKGLVEGANLKQDDKKNNARMTGLQLGQMIAQQWVPGFSQQFLPGDTVNTLSLNNILSGLLSAATKKDLAIAPEDAQVLMQTLGDQIREKTLEKEYGPYKAENQKFLEDNAKKEGVVTLPSGLQYMVITEGKGPKPTENDRVKVDYVGTLINGTEFDSSVKRGTPAEFGVTQVIQGWTEGLQLMPVGSKYKFFIPYNLAYGVQGRPGSIDPYSTLVFEVELLDIVK